MGPLSEGTYKLTVERMPETNGGASGRAKPAEKEGAKTSTGSGGGSKGELFGFVVLLVILIGALLVARYVWNNPGLFAFVIAMLGGLAHEILQSGGMILYPRRLPDGIYLGSLSGAVLGAVTGFTAVATGIPDDGTYSLVPALGGFGVKGGVEALVAQQDVKRALALPSSSP
ncbi:MAG: hypothetical protein ACT4PT_03755 [Methanobacteriota archaeon]